LPLQEGPERARRRVGGNIMVSGGDGGDGRVGVSERGKVMWYYYGYLEGYHG